MRAFFLYSTWLVYAIVFHFVSFCALPRLLRWFCVFAFEG